MEKGDVKIKQTASQMWCLIRLLPLMIGEYVPQGDRRWEVYLMLRDIVEHLFNPVTTEASTYVLETMVRDHHQSFLMVCITT